MTTGWEPLDGLYSLRVAHHLLHTPHASDRSRREDGCLKSGFIERTDSDTCDLCGKCVDVCASDARSIEDGQMLVEPEKCYGCGACEYACPEEAIAMGER